MQELEIKARIIKKLKKLTLEWREYKLELEIEDHLKEPKIDLIKLDSWLTEVFKSEFEKVQKLKPKIETLPKKKLIIPK